jgi:hypothetical protein
VNRILAVILGGILIALLIATVVGAALAPIVMGMEMLTRDREGEGL